MKKIFLAAVLFFSAAIIHAQTLQKLVSTKDININNRMFFDGQWRYRWMSNSILKGGVVTWVSGLTFAVTSASYTVSGKEYSSTGGQITLNAADPSNPRFDVIAVDTAGQIIKLTGTPSAVPAVPQINQATQVYLTQVLIPAGSTTPGGVSSVTVYDENTEWSHAQVDFPSGISFTSTTSPYTGSKSINVTGSTSSPVSASGGIKFFDGSTSYNYYDFSVIRFYIKLKAALPAAATVSVALGNGNEQMTTITAAHGFNPSLVGSYQNVSIPMSDINKLSTTFTTLYVLVNGTSIGYYIDNIQLQSGIGGGLGAGYLTDWYIKNGTDSAFVVINGIPQFRNRIISGGGGGLSIYDYDGTLSGNRTVNGAKNSFNIVNAGVIGLSASKSVSLSADSSGVGIAAFYARSNPANGGPAAQVISAKSGVANWSSMVMATPDSILLSPQLGNLTIDSLKKGNSINDSLIVWNTVSGKIGYINKTSITGAPLNSPAFTGIPTAPTPSTGTNSTQIATAAFLQNQLAQTLTDSALTVKRPVTNGNVKLFETINSTTLQISDMKNATDAIWQKNSDSTISVITLTKAQADSIAKKNLSDSAFDVVRPVTNGTVQMFSKISSTKLQISDLLNSNTIGAIKNSDSTVSLYIINNKQTISTGTATTITNGIQTVYIDPATLLATHTITMPATPYDAQVITFIFGGTVAAGSTVVTTLSFAANAGQTLYHAITPTTAKGGDVYRYMYNSTNLRWTRL